MIAALPDERCAPVPDKFFRSAVSSDVHELPEIDTTVAHIARVYDYWLGGKDNFTVDREVGEKVLEIHPETVLSVQANRKFLARSVRYLAATESIRQFLDADIKDTDEILAGAARLLDFSQPVGVMLVAVLHMLRDAERPQAIVDRLMSAVPAGSFLVISHLAIDIEQETMAEMGRRLNESMTQQFTMRTRAQVTDFFGGLTLLDPGVVRTHEWRPDSPADAETPGVLWAGVARKD